MPFFPMQYIDQPMNHGLRIHDVYLDPKFLKIHTPRFPKYSFKMYEMQYKIMEYGWKVTKSAKPFGIFLKKSLYSKASLLSYPYKC